MKSVRFRLRDAEEEPRGGAGEVAADGALLGGAVRHGGGNGGRPFLLPRVTRPVPSTVATSGSLLVQVMVPVVPSGMNVTASRTGSG